MLIKSIAMLCVASLGLSLPQDPCPDQTVHTTKTIIHKGSGLGCGTVNVEFADIKVSNGKSKGCPSYVVIIPPYDGTKRTKDSKTFTRPSGRVKITRLEFTCGTDWFLIFPIGSSCRQKSSTTFAGPMTYSQYACADLIEPAGEED